MKCAIGDAENANVYSHLLPSTEAQTACKSMMLIEQALLTWHLCNPKLMGDKFCILTGLWLILLIVCVYIHEVP